MKLKQQTPEYEALLKYEDELLECLQNADMATLIQRAIERNLVPVAAKSLDPSKQHQLVCKFIFFSVYSVIKGPGGSKFYTRWLSLLASLRATAPGLLSRLKKYHISLVKALADRVTTSQGVVVKEADILVLVEVLAGCISKWREIATSLGFPRSEIKDILSMAKGVPDMCMREVLIRWVTRRFSTIEHSTVKNLEKAFCSPIEHLEAVAKRLGQNVFSCLRTKVEQRKDGEYVLIEGLPGAIAEYSSKWKEVATYLGFPSKDINAITSDYAPAPNLKDMLAECITKAVRNGETPTLRSLQKQLRKGLQVLRNVINKIHMSWLWEGVELTKDNIDELVDEFPPSCHFEWKDGVCFSFGFSRSEIKDIKSLRYAIAKWAFHKGTYRTLEDFENTLHGQATDLELMANWLRDDKFSSLYPMHTELTGSDSTVLAVAFAEHACKWEEIASCLGSPSKDNSASDKLEHSTIIHLKEVIVASCISETKVVFSLKGIQEALYRESAYLTNLAKKLESFTSEDVLTESDLSYLTDILAEYSSEWKRIAVILNLPEQIPLKSFEEVLACWINGVIKRPTLENMELALSSELVDLGTESDRLRRDIINHGSEKELASSFEILSQTLHTETKEEYSALMEVCVSSSPGDPVDFEWHRDKNDKKLPKSAVLVKNSYSDSTTGILCLHAENLSAEGTYTCQIAHQSKTVKSEPVVLTLLTPVDEHQKVLSDFYAEQPEVLEEAWHPVPVKGRTFISLALIKQEGSTSLVQYGRGTIRGDVDDIYSEKESIMYERAFNNLDSGARLLVEGRPGNGKTTLVNKVSQDWASKKLTFLHNRLLFLVHLRAFCSDPNVDLHDVMKCYYSSNSTINTIIEYAEKHNGLGLCFILDGLDEYIPNKKDAFIFRLIRKEVLPKAVVIVASRPAAAAKFRSIATGQVEVIGFLKEQIRDYVNKYPFSKLSKSAELIRYLDDHPSVDHMCYLPIHAAMVCLLFNLDTRLPETETEIYKEFTKYTILRILNRTADVCLKSIEDMPPQKKRLYHNICKLACTMTSLSKQVMEELEAQSFFDQDEKDTFGLVTIDRMSTRLGFQKMYTFHHLTFQEFLGASFISKLEEEKQIEFIKRYGREKQMQQLWKFYCGLVEFAEDSSSKFKALVSHSELGDLFKIQCCFESQQPHVCDIAIDNKSLHLTGTFLNRTNFSEIAYVLFNSHHNSVELLSFEGCIFDEECVDVLVGKAGDNLDMVRTLCFYYCDIERLRVATYFLNSLPSIEVLDISHSNIGMAEIETLSKGLDHPNLQVLKVGSRGNSLYSCADLQPKLLKIFKSKCKNFMNVCFTGVNGTYRSEGAVASFHCNPPELDLTCLRLRLPEVRALISEFMLNPLYTKVTLINCGIDDVAATLLSLGLNSCTGLELLELGFNIIGNDGACRVCESISKLCSNLSLLDLSFNRISNKGAMLVASTLKDSEELQLILTHNDVTKFSDIVKIHRRIDFHGITIANKDLGDKDITDLAAVLKSSGRLDDVNQIRFHKNRMSVVGFKPLSCVLNTCGNLLVLDLSFNGLGKSGAAVLSETLKCCSMLQELDVSSNHLESAGAKAIAEGLKCCEDLRKLKLNSNNVGKRGASAIAPSLKCCLQLLEIHTNDIGQEGAKALALVFKDLPNLVALDISSNSVLNAGAMAIADALKGHASLQQLNVRNNMIKKDGVQYLTSSLKSCSSISSLDVTCNDIGGSTLAESLPTSLGKLEISNSDLTEKWATTEVIGDTLCKQTLHDISIHNTALSSEPNVASLANTIKASAHSLTRLDISDNGLMSDGCSVIADSLKDCTDLCELSIGCNDIGGAGIKSIAASLQHLRNLTALSVTLNSVLFPDEGVQELARALESCSKIQTFSLSSNNMGVDGAKVLAEGLGKHCPKLSILDISNNHIESEGAIALGKVFIQCKNLKELVVSNNDIDSNIKEFAQSLKQCMNLHKLDISNNSILEEGLRSLSSSLIYCTNLTDLRMRKILYEGGRNRPKIDPLVDVLKHCVSISTLDISINFIGDEGATALAEVLKHTSRLNSLLIKGNLIGPTGAQALAKAMQCCSNLQKLDISYNSIGDLGAEALANSFKHKTRLSELCIGYNEIGPTGSQSLAKACTSLHKLDISYNSIGDVGTEALAGSLRCNSALTELHINCNKIGPHGTRELTKEMMENDSIRMLDISHNPIGDVGAEAFSIAFKHIRLSLLCISHSRIGPTGAEALVKALSSESHQLHTLDISGNSVGVKWAGLLKQHCTSVLA